MHLDNDDRVYPHHLLHQKENNNIDHFGNLRPHQTVANFLFQVGRFSHSANLYHDNMVLFGGELQNGSLTNDLWLYNITLNKWTELAVNDVAKPPPLAEHTATLVDDKLYIFGGEC